MSKIKKLISMASAAAMAITMMTSTISVSAAGLITNGGPYTGDAFYISTNNKSDYYGKEAFEITYKFNSISKTRVDENGDTVDVDFTDTFEFLVFDTAWGGWNATNVGVANPEVNKEYTCTANISDIESKLSTGGTISGINLQTGLIGNSSVTITSLKYVDGLVPSEEVSISGNWVKGAGGTMTVASGSSANVSTNEWNIFVSQFSVSQFINPTVDVTVEYASNPNNYVQAEILNGETPIITNYPFVDVTGTYTYTTEIPSDMTSLTACFDTCIVKSIRIYDNHDGKALNVSGQTATQVNDAMTPCWNLGNALEASDNGVVGETTWGNPYVTQKIFQTIKAQGFKSVRIPVSYLNMVDANGDINDAYLDRVQAIVDRAMDSGLYVIINIHHDGSDAVSGKWLDISVENGSAQYDAMINKFTNMWTEIAERFSTYNQSLIFEGMNEVMITGKYTLDTLGDEFDNAYANIMDLNQAFVSTVRETGSFENNDRCLIICGYNTDINLTVEGYNDDYLEVNDEATDRLILSVHYYDPYDFTLNQYGTNTWSKNGTYGETYMISQLNKLSAINMPIFVGEYCANFKNNTAQVAEYIKTLNAVANASDLSISTAYWDNGVIGINANGSGLIDRRFNSVTTNGQTIINAIK